MLLELALDADDATRLPRLPALTALKTGRMRTRRVRIAWHDSPDGALAQRGLALAEQLGTWRLERLHPAEASWPPGLPRIVLAEGRAPADICDPLPDPLPAVATFEGHGSTLALGSGGGPLSLTLVQGDLHSLSGRRPVCRVWLDGPDIAVQDLAGSLGRTLRLDVPRAGLAAEAMCAALGAALPPRREGAPELPPDPTVAGAFGHVVGHLTDVILHYAPAAATGENGTEPVHQMRVATRRLRSALKVFRQAVHGPAIDAADAGLKVLAGRLGPTRDWDVFVTETGAAAAAAFPKDARLQRLMSAAERRRRACHAELRTYLESAEFRCLGIELACLSGGQGWQAALDEAELAQLASPLGAFAAHMLHKRMKRLAKPDDNITGLEPASLHAIRLHAKRLRYAAEIFAPLYPGKPRQRFLRRLEALQSRLGVLNDGTVAEALLAQLAGKSGTMTFAAGMVVGFLGARADRARDKASRAWERFRKLPPFWE